MTGNAINPTKPFWRCWTTLESGEPFDSIKVFLKYISKQPAKEELQIGSVGLQLDQGVPSRISSGSSPEKVSR